MNSYKLIGISLILSGILVGCGSSSSSSSAKTPTDVTVERGPVYNATVTDSSGQTATQKSGENVYTFADTPTYPITASGGWIDLDGDGVASTSDVQLETVLTSYSTVVTPITTLVALSDETQRQNVIDSLTQSLSVTETELLSLPSTVDNKKVASLANAIYAEVVEDISNGTTTTIAEKFSYENINDSASSVYDDMLNLAGAYFNQADNNGYSISDLESYVINSTGFFTALTTADIEIFNPTASGDSSSDDSSSDTTTFDPSNYSFVAIYKNVSTSYGSGIGSSSGENSYFQSVSSSTGCSNYGFTTQTSKVTVAGITTTTYMASSGICNELDYSGSNYSGSASFVFANNDD